MMRRQTNKSRRDEQALLSPEAAPILSDDLCSSAGHDNNNINYQMASNDKNNTKKKGSWRSRLFGGGGASRTASRSAGRAVSASRSGSNSRPIRKATGRKGTVSAQRGSQQAPDGELRISASSDTATRSSRPSAPLRSRPEKRDDDSNNKAAAKTRALPDHQFMSSSPNKESVSSPASSSASQQQHSPDKQRSRVSTGSSTTSASQPIRSVPAPAGVVASILNRPFGREAVRHQDQAWLVLVAPAEWEGEESIWKYRVTIQKRVQSGEEEIIQDLTNGMTFRSLADFYWLEQALQAEFHGGLLIPPLSISLGVPDLENCQHEVDARLLTNWLGDVLNGVRGQGEWLLASASLTGSLFAVNWQTSEAMEAFMYRADLQPMSDVLPNSLGGKSNTGNNGGTEWEDEKGGILKWVINGDMCGLTSACAPRDKTDKKVLAPPKPKKINLPLDRQTVSSKALGDARTLNIQDSFVEPLPTFDLLSNRTTAQYTDLVQAEQELIWNWRARALSAMEKLRIVQNEEKHIAAAWKRFAISLSNLFAYEKEVESARLGDAKTRKDLVMPYRKLQKSAVDDVLRILAKQKMERCTPSLDVLSVMLSAYVADLSSVQPSVQSYLEALQQFTLQIETVQLLKEAKPEQIPTSTLADQIQAGLDQVKKQLVSQSGEGETGDAKRAGVRLQQAELQLETMEKRVQTNEAMLQEHLTRLCRTVPVRTARMAHGFIQTERKQTGAMHGAAINTRTRITIASKDSLSKMIRRHGIEIKEDRVAELQLVQRMVNLGSNKKFSKTDDGTEEIERGVEINKDTENRKGELRDTAMELCRGRIGRWDSKVAMSIMEAVGVQDANVRVEETTRDLRLVRKYAIGLREHVQRCMEALEVVRMSILQGGFGDIRDLRHDMMSEVQTLFSGAYQPIEEPKNPLNVRALIEKGILLNDPLGWRRKEDGCGGAANAYLETRDSGTEWLLNSLGELLKEYNQRVEAVESFVYMECVGIQLEKHFSQERATALAAFEKKTDITSAINIATRKRMPVLVKELQAKLEAVGADVSHTTVKEAKEAHLESKTLKQELHDLSMRQLSRARETATERVIALMNLWSKEEENASSVELDILKAFDSALELSITTRELDSYLEAAPLAA